MTQNIIVVVLIILMFCYFMWQNNNKKKLAEENIKLGEKYLQENAKKSGVSVFESGLQYRVIEAGNNESFPSSSDVAKVHYHGTLIDGSVFDSSVKRGEPISFGLNQVIPGWTEGLQKMSVGEKAELTIPSHLGYGNRTAGSIPAGSVLIFEVELIAINP